VIVSDQHLLRHGARHVGAVYASRLGMQVSEVSLFMAMLVLGGMLLQ
jgi:hypothetical protein